MANRYTGKSPDSFTNKAQTNLSADQHGMLTAVAKRRGQSVAQYLRRCVATQLAADIQERKSRDLRDPQLTTIMKQMASMDPRSKHV